MLHKLISFIHNRHKLLEQETFLLPLYFCFTPILDGLRRSQLLIEHGKFTLQVLFLFTEGKNQIKPSTNYICMYILNDLQYIELHLPPEKCVLLVDQCKPLRKQLFLSFFSFYREEKSTKLNKQTKTIVLY